MVLSQQNQQGKSGIAVLAHTLYKKKCNLASLHVIQLSEFLSSLFNAGSKRLQTTGKTPGWLRLEQSCDKVEDVVNRSILSFSIV